MHEQTLWVLEKVGVDFESPGAVDLFKKNGAKVEGNRVFIDRKLIERGLSTTITSFSLKGLNSSVHFGTGETVISSTSRSLYILKNNRIMDATFDDFVNIQKLNETSEVLNLVNAPIICVKNLPREKTARVKVALTLKHTSKPIVGFCSNEKEALDSIEIAKKFYGLENEYYILGVGNMSSPLRYTKENTESMLAYAKNNQPLCIAACSTPGITSPVTLGGTLVQNNAEVLAGIVLMQLEKPGTPLIYGNTSFGCDMRYGSPAVGSMETSMMIPYIKELAEFYKLPCRAGGSLTDAKELDWQAGVESTISLYTSLSNDIDFIFHSCGEMDSLNVMSMEKFILDEELIKTYKQISNKKIISENTIDLESIKNVGPGGNFSYEMQTTVQYRQEHVIPKFFNRELFVNWKINGSPSIQDKALQEVGKRIAEYTEPNLEKSQRKVLDEILEEKL